MKARLIKLSIIALLIPCLNGCGLAVLLLASKEEASQKEALSKEYIAQAKAQQDYRNSIANKVFISENLRSCEDIMRIEGKMTGRYFLCVSKGIEGKTAAQMNSIFYTNKLHGNLGGIEVVTRRNPMTGGYTYYYYKPRLRIMEINLQRYGLPRNQFLKLCRDYYKGTGYNECRRY